jgi:hypothetical protein
MTPEELADEIVRDWRRSENTLELKRRIAAALREAERPAETEKVKTRGEQIVEAMWGERHDFGMLPWREAAGAIDTALAEERERCALHAQMAPAAPEKPGENYTKRVRLGIAAAIREG